MKYGVLRLEGGELSEFTLRLFRVFLTLLGYVPLNDLFGNPHREHNVEEQNGGTLNFRK